MKLFDAHLLFLDLQTTGASPATGAPLEIAWAQGCAHDHQHSGVRQYLLKQPDEAPIPKRIQSVTGITEQDMGQAVSWNEVESKLCSSLAESHVQSFVIHYAQFEIPFLNVLLSENDTNWGTICTHQIARRLFPNLPSRGIRGLAGYLGFPLDECKRAETHVSATFAIWKHLCSLLAERGVTTESELRDWLVATPPLKRTAYEYPLDRGLRLSLPDCPGIYKMMSSRGDVLYVGKATSLKDRVNSYFRGRKNRDSRKLEMLTQAWDIQFETCPTVLEASLLEVHEIKRLSPPYNIALNTGLRPLLFYSADFMSQSHEQSMSHPLGPFRSEFVLDAFICLLSSLLTEQWNPIIFSEELPIELIEEGFQFFRQKHGVEPGQLLNPRSALALGAWLYRLRRRVGVEGEEIADGSQAFAAAEAAIAEDSQRISVCDENGTAGGKEVVDEVAGGDQEVVLTAQDVAGKFERLLMRAAAAYLLAKRLTRLLNSTVAFQEKSVQRVVKVAHGVLVEADYKSTSRQFAWQGLAMEEFDRMRVLSTELNRLAATGQLVRILESSLSQVQEAALVAPE